MEKALLCCSGLHVPPSGRVKECKSCFFGPAGGGGGHVVRWEQSLDLLAVAQVMLFIFRRLLMSGSASAPGPGGLTCSPKCPAQKPLRDVPGLVVLTHSALLYYFSCGPRCRPLTLSQSVSLAHSLVSFLFPSSPT